MKQPFIRFIILILTTSAATASLPETMDRLDIKDPEFITYMDLKDDFRVLGNFLSDFYMAYLMSDPSATPIPIDFEKLFTRFGLTTLETVTIASEPHPVGFRNEALFDFTDGPTGIFLFYGDANKPFTVHKTAPIDADAIFEFSLSTKTLISFIRDIANDIMGPMGTSILDAQLTQPLTAEGLTANDIITRLNTRFQVVMKMDGHDADPITPDMLWLHSNVVIHIENIGDLLDSLTPFLLQAGFIQEGETWMLAASDEANVPAFYIDKLGDTNDLLMTLGTETKEWFLSTSRFITENKAYKAQTKGLPAAGTAYWYSSEALGKAQIENMAMGLPVGYNADPLIAALKQFLLRYNGEQAGVSYIDDNAYRITALQKASYKTSLVTAAVALPITMGKGIIEALNGDAKAIPTQPDPASSPE